MEQTRALNALEPFLALSKSANSPRAAVDLVIQATSAPNTYVFAELLQQSNIQALRDSPEHASYLRLLEIFAWGTWQDYTTAKDNLPTLSPAQTQKLKLLSLLPLAAQPTTQLTYDHLRATLDVATTRALEDLLIQAIYSHLITGSLDPAAARVTVTSVAPLRDLAPGSIPALVAELDAWQARCDGTLASLDAEIAAVRRRAAAREHRRRKEELLRLRVEVSFEDKSNAKRSHPSANSGGSQLAEGGGAGGDADAMELDEGIGEEGGASSGGKASRGAKRTAFSGRSR
ncbi:pci domain-containing protein [Diplodia corticola]|uniref:Pci domain-containing protein n=1 Tax=Diplodia corticola TaxID=236234 RepID=A0A1J9S7B5_9PEZI|nr:pci domain-containing protein [Diplodia corticola]OJD35812.1 pci domain-containing protein [Diplodia corticola]